MKGSRIEKKSPFRSLRLALHRLLRRKTTTLDGFLLLCDPAKVHKSVCTAIIKGSYELPERRLVETALKAGDRVLEIGTGVGVVSLLCNRIAGAGNVLSYEANDALAATIHENFALNGMVANLRLKAVTPDGKPVTFFRNANVVSSSVYDRGVQAQRITVESDPLNQILAEHRATVLVIDVEGAELDLMRTADLSGVREIIVELHPHIVGESATEAMIAGICARGFTLTDQMHKNIRLTRRAP